MVTNTNDGGAGSFRQAILDANASAESDLIQFAIPGSGPHTIVTFTPLNVTGPVLIDGYSQPGSAWNSDPIADNAVIQIELLGQGTDGLVITGGGAIVQGLALYGFDAAIALTTVEGSIIQGNFIGTDAAGNATFGNNRGVLITSPFGSDKVGDAYPAARNLISGNSIGVAVSGTGGKSILNNLIGTDRTGTLRQPNGTGVELSSATFTTVGGSPPARNVISGNFGDAVDLLDGSFNAVRYNYIGLDATGTQDVGNGADGVRTSGVEQNYLIDWNVISGNAGNGVTLTDTAFPDLNNAELIQSNRIGTAADGFSPVGNDGAGVRVENHADLRIVDNVVAHNRVGVWAPFTIYNACEIVDVSMFGNRGGVGIANASSDAIAPNTPGGAFNFPIITSVTPTPAAPASRATSTGMRTIPSPSSCTGCRCARSCARETGSRAAIRSGRSRARPTPPGTSPSTRSFRSRSTARR